MMIAKRLFIAAVFCLLLSGMRDPFQPLPDTCQIEQLKGWHFHGVVQSVGIVSDPAGRWHRIVVGQILPAGWRVMAVSPHEIDIATGEECTPERWRWKRKGIQDAKMDSERHAF